FLPLPYLAFTFHYTASTQIYTLSLHDALPIYGKLLFDNTPLKEVCQQIEDQFGLAVSFPDSLMGNRLFNGTFPADNAQVLLKALMKTYQLDAICNGNRVEFRRKEEQPK